MKTIRSIFISDAHLGCKYTHAEALLAFLKNHQPQYLYIVGDFIDGWRLKKSWYWNDVYTFLLRRIVGMMRRGTRVYYTPGNHDEFLRDFAENFGSVQLADEFVHRTADGREILVTHGDRFDAVVLNHRWLTLLGDTGYNLLLAANVVFNALRRRLGFGYWSLSAAVKRRVKQATSYIGRFEDVVTRYAAQHGCSGVVCGHIHTPAISEVNGVAYYNTGDWVESCTALVEYSDGEFELLYRPLNSETVEEEGPEPANGLKRSRLSQLPAACSIAALESWLAALRGFARIPIPAFDRETQPPVSV
ncbi:MAG: UDP-2,3-diacylglucosamine diphosphatase [Planctomycetaceae bacterium]